MFDIFNDIGRHEQPYVFFESPKRLIDTLKFLKENMDISYICCGKELTKKFETIIVGPIETVLKQLQSIPIKGEWVFCFTCNPQKKEIINHNFVQECINQSLSTKQIIALGKTFNWSKNELYDLIINFE